MADLRDVELRIAVAEGVLTRAEAEALGEEARHKKQSPLALLVERGHLTEDSYRSLFAEAMNDPAWRAATQDGSASTCTMGAQPSAPGEPAFPVAAWDRYTNVRFLGQGGMGKVFLAIDTRLRREVAIKFVRGDDAEHVRRLIAEARTQARVRHERVCKVYEVGEVEGKVYIAMQYIEGKPLGALAGELTVEQKVMVVRGAAEGIHEAHRAGIIHRDVKPSNIMVERGDDGELRPYVMDFGLARSAQEAGATMTGTVLGTPHYMPPEQAQGAATQLDRRADVYSLGATLYRLVTGEPPVPGETIAEVIHNLITQEPRPLRAIDPDIPIDLEAIVLKCLERDRSARYDSARALADDLGRFLNGEPVQARPAGTWYRLRKRLAKHRRLVTVGAVALVALAVAIGWAVKTSGEAAERERLARRFTEMVAGIEATARYSALAPPHDIRGDRAVLRAGMADLDDEIRRAGEVAEGPGHYALGRGYLALDDDARALAQLQAAWAAGFREPRVAYTLAIVMGHLYQQGLLATERIEDRAPREARKREVEKQYRDPALAYLIASIGGGLPSPGYFAALLAYYEGHLDQALQYLDAMRGGQTWFHEVPELRGGILVARALTFRHQGQSERAHSDFEAGRRAYDAAAAIGESVPSVYTSLAELEYAEMGMELYGHGDVMPPYGRALAATTRALAVQPDHYEALVLQARIQRRLAEYEKDRGESREDLLAKALADVQRAVIVARERSQAWLEMSQIYRQWGDVLQDRHQDPSAKLREAVAASERVLPVERDAPYYGNRGFIFSLWADYEDQGGVDSQAKRGQAIVAFDTAIRIDDALNDVWINLGIDWFKRAQRPHATDPDGDLRRAIAALDRAKAINPRHIALLFYEGRIHAVRAQRDRVSGLDPEPDLKRAVDAYKAGIALNGNMLPFHNGLGAALLDLAKVAWDRGADPGELLDQASAAFRKAIAVAPKHGDGYGNVGEVLAQRAWLQRARGEDPSASVGAAAEALNQAIQLAQDHSTFWADLGMAYAVQAAYDLEHERDPRSSLEQASTAIRTALDKDSRDVQARLYLAETRAIQARLLAQQEHGSMQAFTGAEQAFQQAVDLDRENPDIQIAFGHFYREQAAWQRSTGGDAGPSLERGLTLARQVLDRHPAWPDALVLRGSLTLLQALLATEPAERRTRAASARDDLSRALKANPALGKAWENQVSQAQMTAR